ncbi:MAG: 2-(1,2-epoxy-1,2-dihydrophenyl)acetyl-CoA isomerase [Paracoccaceae bacterium]|jgi:2-(1,2-epoxy-1,2-dihydrophenyl)acetyl-CoA isomerase
MSADAPLLIERVGDVAVLTLNEPAKRNALTDALRLALRDALTAADADRDVRAIVLTGGEECFSSGGDISAMGAAPDVACDRLAVLHDVARIIVSARKPVIAAVAGSAYGGGLSLALCCDSVVAAPDAKLCASFLKVGLAPDIGMLWTVTRRIGEARALDLILSADMLTGAEAHAIGLVDRLAAPGAVLDAALDQAVRLTRHAPLPVARIKAMLAAGRGGLDAALAAEMDAQRAMFATQDHAEATAAFLARRSPDFTAR